MNGRSRIALAAIGGITMIVPACGGGGGEAAPTVVDGLVLEVQPAAASVIVGGTFPFTVVARNSAGQPVTTPAVAWSSGSQGVATIGATGIATGLGKGTALITASARGVTSTPAVLTVTDVTASAACDGIASVDTFNGSLTYDYAVHGTTDGGFVIDGNYHADVKAVMKRNDPQGTLSQVWSGPLTGAGTLHETKGDPTTPGNTTKLDGSEGIVNVGTLVPTMSLIVNLQTCTYQLTVITALSLTTTNPNGTKSSANGLVATVNVGNTTPLGNWRAMSALPGGNIASYDGHSSVWAATNLGKNSFVPLGFAGQLMAGSPLEKAVGGASVTYVVSAAR